MGEDWFLSANVNSNLKMDAAMLLEAILLVVAMISGHRLPVSNEDLQYGAWMRAAAPSKFMGKRDWNQRPNSGVLRRQGQLMEGGRRREQMSSGARDGQEGTGVTGVDRRPSGEGPGCGSREGERTDMAGENNQGNSNSKRDSNGYAGRNFGEILIGETAVTESGKVGVVVSKEGLIGEREDELMGRQTDGLGLTGEREAALMGLAATGHHTEAMFVFGSKSLSQSFDRVRTLDGPCYDGHTGEDGLCLRSYGVSPVVVKDVTQASVVEECIGPTDELMLSSEARLLERVSGGDIRSQALRTPDHLKRGCVGSMGEQRLVELEDTEQVNNNMRRESNKEQSNSAKRKRVEEYSIEECMQMIEELDVDDDAFAKLMEKFVSLEWRKIFLTMSEKRRKTWVQRL
ncbi:hypothetical protein Q3G72_005806 [Acer saccharum]|nr:hypothetical protein Q3G72_005806 [Acer saccharum]